MIDEKRLKVHMENGEKEYIMCAANHYDDDKDHPYQPYNIDKGFIICGWRHPCCGFSYLGANEEAKQWDNCIQGFLTNKNRFLTRDESIPVAKLSKQIPQNFKGTLTSEDMW
jgi:hypothetical protein